MCLEEAFAAEREELVIPRIGRSILIDSARGRLVFMVRNSITSSITTVDRRKSVEYISARPHLNLIPFTFSHFWNPGMHRSFRVSHVYISLLSRTNSLKVTRYSTHLTSSQQTQFMPQCSWQS